MGSMAYRDLFPEYSGEGLMDDTWWARYGLEEAAMDTGNVEGPYPAHDRLAALMRGEQVGRSTVTSACPSCGAVAARNTYDIGSGPELSCANCEWCWGAEGQPLKPITPSDVPWARGAE